MIAPIDGARSNSTLPGAARCPKGLVSRGKRHILGDTTGMHGSGAASPSRRSWRQFPVPMRGASAMFDSQCDLAAMVYGSADDPDRLLREFADDLRRTGYRPAGLIQHGRK